MKLPKTYETKEDGENQVARIIAKLGYLWRNAKGSDIGLDGFIEVTRSGILSGQIIGVQIKSGRSYLINSRKRKDIAKIVRVKHREIRIAAEYISYFKQCAFPVIVVWFDPISENAFWGEVRNESVNRFPVTNVLDKFSHRQLLRILDRWHANYPTFIDPRMPRLSVRSVKRQALEYYKRCRSDGCVSPVLGPIEFTLRGWRHITSTDKQRAHVIRSLELLGTAREILSKQTQFHVCRAINSEHALLKLTARIKHPDRADAIVSVIVEKFGRGRHQFLSVYEHSAKLAKRVGA
jgi:Domain of unknown function (DUF4365)